MRIKEIECRSVRTESTIAFYGSNANLNGVIKAMGINGWELSVMPFSLEYEEDENGNRTNTATLVIYFY